MRTSARTTLVTLLALAALVNEARAQCYLLDANAECAVCWKTTYGSPEDKMGVTTMSQCHEDFQVRISRAPLPRPVRTPRFVRLSSTACSDTWAQTEAQA